MRAGRAGARPMSILTRLLPPNVSPVAQQLSGGPSWKNLGARRLSNGTLQKKAKARWTTNGPSLFFVGLSDVRQAIRGKPSACCWKRELPLRAGYGAAWRSRSRWRRAPGFCSSGLIEPYSPRRAPQAGRFRRRRGWCWRISPAFSEWLGHRGRWCTTWPGAERL
jgi:hypothetical protein